MDCKRNEAFKNKDSTNAGLKKQNDKIVHRSNSLSSIKCFYTNIDGISSKIDLFKLYIEKESPHVIFVTETKLRPTELTKDFFNFKDYNEFRRDRKNVDGGGGVIILVHNCLNAELISQEVLQDTESVACKINYGLKSVVLGCMYRPPYSPPEYNIRISNAIHSLSLIQADQTLICGDFNYPKIEWNDHIIRASETSSEQIFYDVCQSVFLHQHVDECTRQRGDDEPSMLDLVFSKNEHEIENINYYAPIGKSDHSTLIFDYKLEGNVNVDDEIIGRKKFFKADYTKINFELQKNNWNTEMSEGDLATSWHYFTRSYNEVTDLLIPTEMPSKGSPKNKWMTRYAQYAVEKKAEAWEFYRKRRSKARYDRYKRACNNAVYQVRQAKMNFEKSLANEIKRGDTAAFYSYLRSKTKIKEGVSNVLKPDGTLTSTNSETANVINNTLQSVFVREGDGPIPQPTFVFHDVILEDIDFTEETVKDILDQLKESLAPGPDGIHAKVLKECSENLAQPLYLIFRKSLDEGVVPDDWKQANVTPIYKKGKKIDPSNYRPISLTSVPCKVMERIVKNSIIDHLEQNSLLSKHQHGFRSNRSCLTQLLEYFTEISDMLETGDPVDAIYLDCRKAFDTVPHKRLLAKLKAYGISGKILKWIESFLSNRSQRVSVKGVLSDPLPVLSGVPQGSVLGPVLFLIYINDLLDGVKSSGKLFADDSKIFRKISSNQDKQILQEDLTRLHEWSRKWLLEFNESKCSVMHLGRTNQGYNYSINDTVLTESNEEKDLGVYVTSDWKSSTHVARVAAKANAAVGRIKKTFTYMDSDIFKAIYPGLVRSHIEYAVQS